MAYCIIPEERASSILRKSGCSGEEINLYSHHETKPSHPTHIITLLMHLYQHIHMQHTDIWTHTATNITDSTIQRLPKGISSWSNNWISWLSIWKPLPCHTHSKFINKRIVFILFISELTQNKIYYLVQINNRWNKEQNIIQQWSRHYEIEMNIHNVSYFYRAYHYQRKEY